jgi:recombination protein RecA
MATLIANAQALGIRCAGGDMEHTWDLDYMRKLGVQVDKLYYYQPSSGTQCLDIADKCLKSGLFGLIVTDSVASLVTDAELAGDVGDAHVAARARLMSQTLAAMNTHLTQGSQCVLAFTNQERDTIGGYGGKATPGGKALKFYASNRVQLYRSGFLTKNEIKYGQKVHATVIKNKSAPPYRTAECDLIWGKGIDYVAELFDLSVARGLIQASGSWYSLNKKPLGQGRDGAVDKIRSRPDTLYALYDKLMTAAMADRGMNPDGSMLEGWVEPAPTTMAQTFMPIPGAPPLEQWEAEDEALARELEGKAE